MLDLYGFGNEIAILSSSKRNIVLLDEIMDRMGSKTLAKDWLPVFYQALKMRKESEDQVVNYDEIIANCSSNINHSESEGVLL